MPDVSGTGTRRSLPPAARHILTHAIRGVEELQVILLLHRHADRYWDAEAVADRVGLQASRASAALEALAGHGFLDVRLTDVINNRYNPATPEQLDLLESIASLWRADRTALLELLTMKRRALTDFSEAFRLRKGKTDG